MSDFILLKWGTLKSYDFTNSPEALLTLQEYHSIEDSGIAELSLNTDSPKQKDLLCKMIDQVNGEVRIYWGNEDCTNDREKAKKYVRDYGSDTKIFPEQLSYFRCTFRKFKKFMRKP